MKNQAKITATLFAITSVFASCSADEGDNSSPKVKTSQQKVVINKFNVVNKGHMAAEAHESANMSSYDDAILHYRTMMAMNSEVAIQTSNFFPEQNNPCSTSTRGYGSGTLTSPTRVLTNFHVISGWDQAKVSTLTFESVDRSPIPDPLLQSGIWYGDDINPPAISIKESPFLPNRLFALGLDHWADRDSNNDHRENIRNELRNWNFGLDESISTQKFLQDVGGHWEGKDLAVLKIIEKIGIWTEEYQTDSSHWYIPSGRFGLNTPAPFFDFAMPMTHEENNPENCDFTPSTTDRLYANHHQNYGYNVSGKLGVLSSPGYRSNYHYDDPGITTECLGSNVFQYRTLDNYEISSDVTSGSSGGGVFGRPCRLEMDGAGVTSWTEPMNSALVHIGANVATEAGPNGNWPIVRTSFIDYPNGDPCDVEQNDFPFNHCEAGHNDFSLPVNVFHLFNEHDTKWAKRTTDYSGLDDPFNPKPHYPEDDGCPGMFSEENGRCEISISESESSGSGAYAGSNETPPSLVSDIQDLSDVPHADGLNEKNSKAYEKRLAKQNIHVVWCNTFGGPTTVVTSDDDSSEYVSPGRKVSMMQGLMGSIKSFGTHAGNGYRPPADNENARVDALTQVCTPWSSATWFENWKWATINVESVTRMNDASVLVHEDNLFDNQGWRLLSEAFHFIAEVRQVGFTVSEQPEGSIDSFFWQMRPPAMKTCPPNYYLHGVRYATKEEDNERLMMGIESLICRAHHRPFVVDQDTNIEELVVPLYASEHTGFEMPLPKYHEKYPYFNGDVWVDFDIHQYIGHLMNHHKYPRPA